MIDIMAAICLEQMKKLPANLEFRRHVQKRYNEELHPVFERPPHSETVQYYCPRITEKFLNVAPDGSGYSGKISRDNLIDYLADKKIHTSVHFKPLYLYEPLKQDRSYPICDREWTRFITLPCHNRMKEEDIDYVIYWVNKWVEDKYL